MGIAYTEEDIAEALFQMPVSIQNLLNGDEIVTDIFNITKKYSNVSAENNDEIIRDVGLMILMLKPFSNDYYDDLYGIVGEIPNLRELADDLNAYFKGLIDRLEKMMPRETIDSDTTLWASSNGRNVITSSYFKLFGYEEYPLSYIRSVQLLHMSGLDQPGSISSAIMGLFLGLGSLALLSSSNMIMIILGIVGIYISYVLIKTPFKKSRPMGRITFHPNLGLEDINIGWLGKSIGMDDNDIVDFVKILQQTIRQ